jgi:hypothetical protein
MICGPRAHSGGPQPSLRVRAGAHPRSSSASQVANLRAATGGDGLSRFRDSAGLFRARDRIRGGAIAPLPAARVITPSP